MHAPSFDYISDLSCINYPLKKKGKWNQNENIINGARKFAHIVSIQSTYSFLLKILIVAIYYLIVSFIALVKKKNKLDLSRRKHIELCVRIS